MTKETTQEAFNRVHPLGYRIADYPSLAPKDARISIKRLLDANSFAIQVTPLISSTINEAPADSLESNLTESGIVWVNAYYDGSANTGKIKFGQPVVFDTVSGRGVTGVNDKWSRTEYKVVGVAWKSHETVGWVRIPVKLIQESVADAEVAYIAVPECDSGGIPARSGNVPGKQRCCIYTIEAGVISPVMVSGPSGDEILREDVYNVRDVAVPQNPPPYEHYFLVNEVKGVLVCEVPEGVSSGTSASSTTTTSSDPYATPTEVCLGLPKYTWHASPDPGYWEVVDATVCVLSSSSTSTSTYPPGTSLDCLCPKYVDPTSSTCSTSSTSSSCSSSTSCTTTTNPCKPSYPQFCGLDEGDCTYTYCSKNPITTGPCNTTSCTSSSSTSTSYCDCKDQACGTCYGYTNPITGPVKISDTCRNKLNGYLYDICYCTYTNKGACTDAGWGCTPYPKPSDIKCGGKCQFVCNPNHKELSTTGGWIQLDTSNCYGGFFSDGRRYENCNCPYPTQECVECGAGVETNCSPSPLPGTTQDPYAGICPQCFPSSCTSSTTTTADPCGPGCYYIAIADGKWELTQDDCNPGCTCIPPAFPSTSPSCEKQHTSCFPGSSTSCTSTCSSSSSSSSSSTSTTNPPTTTTTSTTTSTTCTSSSSTTTTLPYWCFTIDCGFEQGNCLKKTQAEAEADPTLCSGPYATLKLCQDSDFCNTSSTSSTTTTCDPQATCNAGCTISCDTSHGVPGVYTVNRICEGLPNQCGGWVCDLTVDQLSHVNGPCDPFDPFPIPCCNTCTTPGNTHPCGTTTTTTTLAP